MLGIFLAINVVDSIPWSHTFNDLWQKGGFVDKNKESGHKDQEPKHPGNPRTLLLHTPQF